MLLHSLSKRNLGASFLGLACLLGLTSLGCVDQPDGEGQVLKVWSSRGIGDGRFQKPRAIAIDAKDQLYIVDVTARIQVFDRDGNFLRSWRTPDWTNGKPSGLSFDNDGNLLVADTHYYQMLVYNPRGELLKDRKIGGTSGFAPGEFGLVTDAVQDADGNYYIAEYGDYDRIQKFSRDGTFLFQWGGHGSKPGQFIRPQNLAFDPNTNHLWVADACNHRIQVFDATSEPAKLVRIWGDEGTDVGQIRYPYDIVLDIEEKQVYIAEFGNHRVQKFNYEGESLGSFGAPGRQPGQMHQPWAMVRDSSGVLHVLDTYNHRVQQIKL